MIHGTHHARALWLTMFLVQLHLASTGKVTFSVAGRYSTQLLMDLDVIHRSRSDMNQRTRYKRG
jgi:hypothetical protein